MILKISKYFVAVVFILAGIAALLGAGRFVDEFTRWGYSGGVLVLIAILEIVCGVLLLIPQMQRAGSSGLLLIVVWGLLHHIMYQDPFTVMIPGIVLTILLFANLFFQVRDFVNLYRNK